MECGGWLMMMTIRQLCSGQIEACLEQGITSMDQADILATTGLKILKCLAGSTASARQDRDYNQMRYRCPSRAAQWGTGQIL